MAALPMIGMSFVVPRKEPTLVTTHEAAAPNRKRSESGIRDKQDECWSIYWHFTSLL
jgi:hypothetical protein